MSKNISIRLLVSFFILTVVFSAAVDTYAQKRPSEKARRLAAEGDTSFKQKDYRAAISKYAEAIVLSPDYPRVRFYKAYAHYYLNEYDASVEDLNAALSQGYTPALEVYKLRWYVHKQRNNDDEALSDMQEVLRLQPQYNDFLLWNAMGDIYRGKGNCTESTEAYKKALQINPNEGDIQYYLAECYSKAGDLEQQRIYAEGAVKRNSKYSSEANFLLADAFTRTKNFAEAIPVYERILVLKPEMLEFYFTLADMYRHENKLNEAITTARKALRYVPNSGTLYKNLSWYYSLADRHQDAVAAGQAAVQFAPEDYASFTNLCRAYNDTKQYRQAVAACGSALKLKPDDGETHFYLGRANEMLNRNDAAADHYKKAVAGLLETTAKNPYSSDGFYLLGNAYYASSEQTERAIEAYKKSLELNPNFGKARYNLGMMYFAANNQNAAREQYSLLMKTDPALAERLKQAIDGK